MELIEWKRCLDNQRHCWDKLQVADLWNQSPWSLQPCSCRSSLDPCGPQMATGCNMFLKVCCHFLLGFKDVEGKTGKSWEITNIPKHSQTIYIRILPPTSTYIHESYQAASVPWVPSGCTFSDAISLGSAGMPLSFTSATWWKRGMCWTPGMI